MQVTEELGEHIVSLSAHIQAATQRLLSMIAEFDLRKGWQADGHRTCAEWLSCNARMSMSGAYAHVQVALCLVELPAIDEAFGQGKVSYTQVRAMVRVADEHNEERLLAAAEKMSGQELELLCRGMRARDTAHGVKPLERYVRQRSMGDGTVEVRIRLTVDEAELLSKAMREVMAPPSETSEVPEDEQRDARRADAVVQLARRVLSGGSGAAGQSVSGAERTMLLVNLRVTDSSAEDELPQCSATLHESGEWLSRETFERLSCDCTPPEAAHKQSVVAKTDAQGNVLDIGRKSRSIPAAIARALKVRDERCTWPGCCNHAYLDAHHVQHWGRGQNGKTSLKNLCRVCTRHHTLLHEGGFRVERTVEGGLRFFAPSGKRLLGTRPPPEPIADPVGMLAELNIDAGLP